YFVDEVDPAPLPKRPGKGLTEYVLRTGEPLLASPQTFAELVAKGETDLIGGPSVDWLVVPLKRCGRARAGSGPWPRPRPARSSSTRARASSTPTPPWPPSPGTRARSWGR